MLVSVCVFGWVFVCVVVSVNFSSYIFNDLQDLVDRILALLSSEEG